MQGKQYPEIPDDFGHWLAGFIAGEGSFGIYPRTKRRGYYLQFVISLRADDRPILDNICRTTGLGVLSYRQPPQGNALTTWRVHRRQDMLRLITILDHFPLRAKKADDYAIWRRAALYLGSSIHVGGRGRTNDWEPIGNLADELAAIRRFSNPN